MACKNCETLTFETSPNEDNIVNDNEDPGKSLLDDFLTEVIFLIIRNYTLKKYSQKPSFAYKTSCMSGRIFCGIYL